MNSSNHEELVKRILQYYRKLLRDEYVSIDDAVSKFSQTKSDVVVQLLPYAIDNNFWWEKEDITMAYYQMRNPILVVNYRAFKKYYHKLMGKKFSEADFNDADTREKLLKESDILYNKKTSR